MNALIFNPKETLKQLANIRNISSKDPHHVLDKVSRGIDWELLAGSVDEKINDFSIDYKSSNLIFVLRALALEILFDIPVQRLNSEITDRKSYQKFLGIHNNMEIPSTTLCTDVKNALYDRNIFDNLTNLIEIILVGKDAPVFHTRSKNNVDYKIDQLEEKIKKIQDFDVKHYINGSKFESEKEQEHLKETEQFSKSRQDDFIEKSKMMTEKLKEVNEKIDRLVDRQLSNVPDKEIFEPSSNEELMNKLRDIDEKLRKLSPGEAQKIQPENIQADSENIVYKKLFDSFYNQLHNVSSTIESKDKRQDIYQEPEIKNIPGVPVQDIRTTAKETEKDVTSDKLSKIEEEIKKLYDKIAEKDIISPKQDFTKEKVIGKEKVVIQKTTGIEGELEEESENEIDLRRKKRYHIFNNTNLTEDYELGLRFYKLGYKTAFINMRADESDENSRIATAEYFPNTFWGSVKQRSRWIAGIVFQNWKIHKWEGSMKTKYFLLRDRKALFSFFGILLSNIVFLYFTVYMVGLFFGYNISEPLVQKDSVLWYLMIATLFFLIIRVVHRFALTYNWYGFKYAALSIVRLLFDNLINLFATIRAIKVYKTNKKQIIWDSTDHY